MHKVDMVDTTSGAAEGIWMELVYNRDGSDVPIGSESNPAFTIKKHGPVLADYQGEPMIWDQAPKKVARSRKPREAA
jgi:hypothetical protein